MWYHVGSSDDFLEGEAVTAAAGNRQVAVYSIGGRLFATDALCSHGLALLSDGYLDGEEIECPLHQGRFHVPTGRALCSPVTEDIRTYQTRIEDGQVFVMVE